MIELHELTKRYGRRRGPGTREAHQRDPPTIQARISYSATLLTGKDQA